MFFMLLLVSPIRCRVLPRYAMRVPMPCMRDGALMRRRDERADAVAAAGYAIDAAPPR